MNSTTETVPASTRHIERAAGLLRAGEIVAFPTETVYGLGANALDATAVARIFAAKERPSFDPLIVHVATVAALAELTHNVPGEALELAHRFWPGPLTLVLPRAACVPPIVTAGLPSVAVRIPDHPVARELITRSGFPLAAPSANRFGRVSPTHARHVAEQLAGRIPLILDGGPCRVGVESTIVSFTTDPPTLLRPGGIPVEEIEALVGPLQTPDPRTLPSAPGCMPRHYAPRTPLVVVESVASVPPDHGDKCALLFVLPNSTDPESEPTPTSSFAHVEMLSLSGDLNEAAANLFSAMHRLDAAGYRRIYAVAIPREGLGHAIMDRLQRAGEP